MRKYSATIFKTIQKTPTAFVVRLKFDGPVPFDFKPGQYVKIYLEKDGEIVEKPYSISSLPSEKNYIEFIIKHVEGGFSSSFMTSRKPGERVEVSEPKGKFILREPIQNNLVFVAVGSGLSSVWTMLQRVFEIGTEKTVWLIFGNRTEDEIIYKEVIDGWVEKYPNFKFIPVISRPSNDWKGEVGHVQEALVKYIKNPKGMEIYICGLTQMVDEVKEMAAKMGFDTGKIYSEEYV